MNKILFCGLFGFAFLLICTGILLLTFNNNKDEVVDDEIFLNDEVENDIYDYEPNADNEIEGLKEVIINDNSNLEKEICIDELCTKNIKLSFNPNIDLGWLKFDLVNYSDEIIKAANYKFIGYSGSVEYVFEFLIDDIIAEDSYEVNIQFDQFDFVYIDKYNLQKIEGDVADEN